MTSAPGSTAASTAPRGRRRVGGVILRGAASLLLAACGLLPVETSVPRETLGGEPPVVVPLRRRADGLYVFEATLGAAGRRDVALDTGSSLLFLRGETADALGFERKAAGAIYLHGADRSALRTVRRGRVPSLRLDGDDAAAEFRDVDAAASGDATFPDLVGTTLFDHGLLTLDFPGERLVFGRGELPPPDGATILALSDVDGVPAAEVSVAGRTFLATIDTGFTGGLAAPSDVIERLPRRMADDPIVVETIHGARAAAVGLLDAALTLGAFDATKVPLLVHEGSPLLGLAVLRRFVITIDRKNRRLRLATPAPPRATSSRAAIDAEDLRARSAAYLRDVGVYAASGLDPVLDWPRGDWIACDADPTCNPAAPRDLFLPRTERVDAAFMAALVSRPPGRLFLPDVRALDVATARALAALPCELYLDGLGELSATTASALVEKPRAVLALRGLKTLDVATAEALASARGALLLDGVATMDVAAAKALARWSAVGEQTTLSLNGLVAAGDDVLRALADVGGWGLALGLRDLSPVQAEILAACRTASLELDGLATISPATAAAMSRWNRKFLALNRVRALPPDVRAAIERGSAAVLWRGWNR